MMKWVWITLGVALLAAGGYCGYLAYQRLAWPAVGYSSLPSVATPTASHPKLGIHWGAVVRPFALDIPGQPTTWQTGLTKQLDLIKEMGGTVIRANIESNAGVMDAMITGANERGLDVLLVLEVAGDNPVLNQSIKTEQLYQLGLNLGRETASRYKGKVTYYQLANEVTGTAAHKPNDTGPTLPNRYNLQFDQNRADRLVQYEKGLADGVRQGDRNAQRMITGHWVLVDIMPYLIQHGVNFEIVGWDWYSDMGTDPAHTKVDGQPDLDLPGTMTDLGKKFWLAEVNKESGSFKGTGDEQAKYLKDVATIVVANSKISGLVVHMLPDMAAEQGKETGELGLTTVKKLSDGTWTFSDPKPAYTVLKKIFLSYQNHS